MVERRIRLLNRYLMYYQFRPLTKVNSIKWPSCATFI
nr:MAG TPA: hypothetical protein [Bacteriophage sp.]